MPDFASTKFAISSPMVEYQRLIARAVKELPNSDEDRQELYERARSVLVTELRAFEPALAETAITEERLALEEAIRTVDVEQKQRPKTLYDNLEREMASLLGRPNERLEEVAGKLEEELRHLCDDKAKKHEEYHRRLREEEAKRRENQLQRERDEQNLRANKARTRLAEMASPAPSLTPDGRLDAGPNLPYDVPTANDGLLTLPIRQRALIKTILSGLPRNAPKQLKKSLENYDDELRIRGVQPILDLLKDMEAIIEADLGAPNAMREWLEEGMREAFRRFTENHNRFLTHFPLDPEREDFYQNMNVDEAKASGRALSGPFEAVAEATLNANKVGLTTDDFLKIVDKVTEIIKFASSLPPAAPQLRSEKIGEEIKDKLPLSLAITSEDMLVPSAPQLSMKKRSLLSGFGFLERVYNLIGTTVALLESAEGKALNDVLREALRALSKLIGF